tara:strand:- start:342 stop:557 length:216 start_codon:yes stop_codon:yes gene_type:complete
MKIEEIEFESFWTNEELGEVCVVKDFTISQENKVMVIVEGVLEMEEYADHEGQIPFYLESFLEVFEPVTDI